jgi:hypothetical protein
LKKDAGVGGLDKDASDAANKEWNKSAKKAVEGIQVWKSCKKKVRF